MLVCYTEITDLTVSVSYEYMYGTYTKMTFFMWLSVFY